MIVRRQSIVKVTGDDDTAEVYGDRSYGKIIANLIGNGVENLFWQPFLDRALLVKKGDLAKYGVLGRSLRRTVDNSDIVTEIARDPGQHTRIGSDSGPFLKCEVETIENDTLHHSDPGSLPYAGEFAGQQTAMISCVFRKHRVERQFTHRPGSPACCAGCR